MERTGAQRRRYNGMAFLSGGFRPFFLCGAAFGALAVPLWLLILQGLATPAAASLGPIYWHAHEMIFGYLGAIIGGFLLTAIPNWTGRLPVMGARLAGLLSLWFIGRIAVVLLATTDCRPSVILVLDIAYPVALLATTLREIVRGRNWRNLPVMMLLATFTLADLLFYANFWIGVSPLLGIRLALAVAALLISLIGGRIVPSFTRNWLVKQGEQRLPASFGPFDKVVILLTGFAVLAWVPFPDANPTGLLLLAAGTVQFWRLTRWHGWRTTEAIVFVLHLGYAWLALALVLMGLAILLPDALGASSALHALTAGAIGTMTIAVMTRATLGHTGREISADRGTQAIYLLVNLGALLRVAAPSIPGDYLLWVSVAGTLWSLGLLLFVGKYGRYLTSAVR